MWSIHLWLLGLVCGLLLCCQRVAAEVGFLPQTVDDRIEIGYGLAIGDVDGDGRSDILLADKSEVVWYWNPGSRSTAWTRHLMVRDLTERDNVCLAARDLDGDGRVEVAVGANWNPGETSDTLQSGAVFFLLRPSDPRTLWRSVPISPYDPTTHRMHWVRWLADGYRLLVLPLHGRGNQNGAGLPVRLMAYNVLLEHPEGTTGEVVHESLHMAHNFDVVAPMNPDQPESIWVAGREGLAVASSQQAELAVPAPPSAGAGEVRVAHVTGRGRNLVAIEPMHGSEVVFYEETARGQWRRQVLDHAYNQGHALAAGDLLGLGRDQVVGGWRNPNAEGRVGIRLYVPDVSATAWQTQIIDDNQMACEDLKLADLDGDGRLDIIAAGRNTRNLIIYWNQTTLPSPDARTD